MLGVVEAQGTYIDAKKSENGEQDRVIDMVVRSRKLLLQHLQSFRMMKESLS